MDMNKELVVCKKKLEILSDLLFKTREQVNFLERSMYRDMKDRWQFAKDLGHPVTGNITPDESSELLVMSLCGRDRGN